MSGSDHVKPASPALKLTYDDFVLFPDDGKRHELIDGEHYVTASPNMRHQQISMNLVLLVGNWLEEHPVGHHEHAPDVGEFGCARRKLLGERDVFQGAAGVGLQIAERPYERDPNPA